MTFSLLDQRRLAIEILATLVNIKRTAADQLLRRANVPEPLIGRFLSDRYPATGTKLSKRVAGARCSTHMLPKVAKPRSSTRSAALPPIGVPTISLPTNIRPARRFRKRARSDLSLLSSANRKTIRPHCVLNGVCGRRRCGHARLPLREAGPHLPF